MLFGTVPPSAVKIEPTVCASSGSTTKSCIGQSVFLLSAAVSPHEEPFTFEQTRSFKVTLKGNKS